MDHLVLQSIYFYFYGINFSTKKLNQIMLYIFIYPFSGNKYNQNGTLRK